MFTALAVVGPHDSHTHTLHVDGLLHVVTADQSTATAKNDANMTVNVSRAMLHPSFTTMWANPC
jgi:hypothetical protein